MPYVERDLKVCVVGNDSIRLEVEKISSVYFYQLSMHFFNLTGIPDRNDFNNSLTVKLIYPNIINP